MPAEDIGYVIFVQLFGMAEYPSSPFTGNIIRDLIQFLFIPTVFILLLIYMILGRLFSLTLGAQVKLRVLVGVAIYLFILTSGYYKIFAYLAGPYFIFLIFILGLFYFIFSHFGARGEGGGHYPESRKPDESILKIGEIDREIEDTMKELEIARKTGSKDEARYWAEKLDKLREERAELEKKLKPWRI
ncbi:MAG: hypothetical protein QXD48_03695 [Candidatus Aenigmatarchaeota archaeon]